MTEHHRAISLDEPSPPKAEPTPGLVGILENLLREFKAADMERLSETYAAQDEAEKWKKEGDDYGWNFHMGRSSGITEASFYFHSVRRRIEELLKEQQALAALIGPPEPLFPPNAQDKRRRPSPFFVGQIHTEAEHPGPEAPSEF
jgi:hypothetical protein